MDPILEDDEDDCEDEDPDDDAGELSEAFSTEDGYLSAGASDDDDVDDFDDASADMTGFLGPMEDPHLCWLR